MNPSNSTTISLSSEVDLPQIILEVQRGPQNPQPERLGQHSDESGLHLDVHGLPPNSDGMGILLDCPNFPSYDKLKPIFVRSSTSPGLHPIRFSILVPFEWEAVF
jgi:hypothetical protein